MTTLQHPTVSATPAAVLAMPATERDDFRGAEIVAQGWRDDASGLWRVAFRLRDGQLAVRDYRYEIEPAFMGLTA